MSLLPFGELPPHRPRRFLPPRLDLGVWEQIEPWFDRLEERLAGAGTVEALGEWILDWGELSAALDEEASRRHIAMTCHTDSAEAEAAYLHYIEWIEPAIKPRQFRLERGYLAHPCFPGLSAERYEMLNRSVRVRVELFREENVALETEEARLGQQYQKLSGSLTVQFQGEERTLAQMSRFLEEPDRELRRTAWQTVANRRLQEADRFEEQLEGLLGLRERMARNCQFADYRDYAFRARQRFDYGPADCERFHEAIETQVVPLLRELQAERRRQMGLETLRPWDLAVDPLGRAALRPFQDAGDLVTRTGRIMDRLDPELAGQFRILEEKRLLDLVNRKGKAPGGYQSTLAEARLPFIFMNSVGVQRDVETLLHEAGHAFHALATRDEDLYAYRSAPIEFCEVASMSMELLGNDYLEEFYPAAEARRARREHLEGIVEVFPWIASVDAFQHWLYTHPGHTRAERRAAWGDLMTRFGGDVDWGGHEEARATSWHRQLHIYLYPFYYIEYGIAQLGALQVWVNARKNRGRALGDYRAALGLGGARPLPELFRSAGCSFDFRSEAIRPLLGAVRAELAALSDG